VAYRQVIVKGVPLADAERRLSKPREIVVSRNLPIVKRSALRASEVAAVPENSRLKSRVAATTAIRRSISGPVAKASRAHRAQDRFVRVDPAIGRELVLSATTFSSTLESPDSHSVAAW
jgi:hypothetical protein